MEDRPVYGARVADIMTNMLMKNREIQKMVQDISRQSRKPIKSSFCLSNGVGKIKISPTKFLEEQKKYLLEGTDASYKSRFLENGRVSLREPSE